MYYDILLSAMYFFALKRDQRSELYVVFCDHIDLVYINVFHFKQCIPGFEVGILLVCFSDLLICLCSL